MAFSHLKSKRKQSGSVYKHSRKKRQNELGRIPALTKIDNERKRNIRSMGSNRKIRLLSINIANIYDSKSKKYLKAKIKTTTENPANKHFVRRNILTKGSIIDTDAGKARITSRPGQDGLLNAVLIS